ncbi:MAG: hypothetical protein ABI210_03910 [Abditibacteriaceae bacterium]
MKKLQMKRTVLGCITIAAYVASISALRSNAAPSQPVNIPNLGINADLNGYRPFPDDNAWNTPVDALPLDPKSDVYINSIGLQKPLHPDFGASWNGGPFGIPYIVVDKSTSRVPLTFMYANESDAGPYPFPANTPIEGSENSDGDRHALILDRDAHKLYEIYTTQPQRENGKIVSIKAGSGAIWDLTSNKLRPFGWTSADAAGLTIFPGLVRYDEVHRGEIRHALRFTVRRTQRGYILPATHWASRSRDQSLPPMGLRFRLKSDFDISGYPPSAQVILKALKTYGMILADNGGDWFLSGAPDARWNDAELNTLKKLRGHDFEAVKTGAIVTG